MAYRYIRDVLARDLSQRIEEVISLSQQEEQAVYTEITEYIVTEHIREHYRTLLKAIAEMPSRPSEGIGVWVSGFFGSGKSSFVKNLGYVLANRPVLGRPASDLFIEQVQRFIPDEDEIPNLIRNINSRIPAEVIMFDVSVDRAVQRGTERIAEVMYRVLLRELDYAQRFDLAELEIELEDEGRLADFITVVAEEYLRTLTRKRVQPAADIPPTLEGLDPLHYGAWRRIRSGAQGLNRASAALHELDPATYPARDSWARSVGERSTDVTVRKLVERSFELTRRRRPGRALVYIIDEVGQYVARSADKILDLQAVVREFGPVGRNKVIRGEAVAPVWVIVTAQEKLEEIVDAIGSRRIELAKLQDSFRYRIDLGPADIQEVATRRVLAKKSEAVPALREMYQRYKGQLNARFALERSGRFRPIEQEEFVETYPYLPHHITLSIDIMSGLRLQPGAPRHLGGSNRTIIKQAYEMLVNPRTRLADAPLGALVTLDKVYELVEANLSNETQQDIAAIVSRYGESAWETRVAKALVLMEAAKRDLPRTARNIAALLIDHLDQPPIEEDVKRALERLSADEFIREVQEGWKLLTAVEKTWQSERNELAPRPADEMELLSGVIGRLWEEPGLRTLSYRGLRAFSFRVMVEQRSVNRGGDIPLHILVADDEAHLRERVEQSRVDTRAQDHRNEVYWHFQRTVALDRALTELYRSQQMINKYEQLQAQGRLREGEAANLEEERRTRDRWQRELDRLVREALATGVGVFQGEVRHGSELGRTWNEVVHSLLNWIVPQLYDKLEMGAVSIGRNVAEAVLRAANLSGLPPEVYEGKDGLALVIAQNGRYVPNPEAPVAREVLGFLRREQEYGIRVSGRRLEEAFREPPYGWSVELLQLILAVLLRAGQIEVIYQGRTYRSHTNAQVRAVFGRLPAFRNATFAPRMTLDIPTLARAVERLEGLTGQEVDVEENAIAEAAREFAAREMEQVRLWVERAHAHSLPVVPALEAYREELERLAGSESDEIVRILAGEGQTLQALRTDALRASLLLSEDAIQYIACARQAAYEMWPALRGRPGNADLAEDAEALPTLLHSTELPEHLNRVREIADRIAARYRETYQDLHLRRGDAYQTALTQIQTLPEWEQVDADERERVISELVRRACTDLDMPDGEIRCQHCRAIIDQMDSDLAAVDGLRREAERRLRALVPVSEDRPQPRRLRVAELAPGPLRSPEDVEAFLQRLRRELLALIDEAGAVELE